MENQVFNYEIEAQKVTNLFDQNLKDGILAQENFNEKTKFSLDEVLDYVEYAISTVRQEKWIIRKILFYNDITNQVELRYYAIEKTFDSVFKGFIRVGTEIEKETNDNIEFLENNEIMIFIGSKTTVVKDRSQIFDFVKESDEEQKNYIQNDFFKFPEEYDFLYNIIVDHINRKNNEKNLYQKKSR